MSESVYNRKLFRTPFSREYWAAAVGEFRNPNTLVFAALILALRVALKPFTIPIVADLNESLGFIVNAFGSMVYGPVVALLSGALSDTLGYLLFPNGPYFPGFILTEMAGSFVFALFLYRAEITVPRLLLCRFCVCFFVNVVLAYPVWVLYYRMMLGREYAMAWIRVVKNIAMFPVETVILAVVFRYLLPPFRRLGYILSGTEKLEFTKKHAAMLAALLLLGAGTVAGYFVYDYNTKSFSAGYSAQERLEKNRSMKAIVLEEIPDIPEEELVTVVESARSRVFSREMTYEIAIYRIDPERFAQKQEEDRAEHPDGGTYTLDKVNGYSKSPAAKDDALVRIGSGTVVTDKNTGEKISCSLNLNR